MKGKNKSPNKQFNYKRLFAVIGIVVIALTGHSDFFVFRPILFFLHHKRSKGVVINEKNAMRGGLITSMYTFSYSFVVGGKTYKGDTHEEGLIIGDSLNVIYNPIFPIVNRREFDGK